MGNSVTGVDPKSIDLTGGMGGMNPRDFTGCAPNPMIASNPMIGGHTTIFDPHAYPEVKPPDPFVFCFELTPAQMAELAALCAKRTVELLREPDAEKESLRAKVAKLEAQLAAVKDALK